MKIIVFFLISILSTKASCQSVFQKLSFAEAVTLSQNNGKMILIQLESFECEMCNYLGNKAFENEALFKKVQETFIPIKVDTKNYIIYQMKALEHCLLMAVKI
jgi:thioredoxin-related protein